MQPQEIIQYWMDIGPKGWWRKDTNVDNEIISRFGDLHQKACNHELENWMETGDGALALILVLDQFSRNMFRGSAKAFAQDKLALAYAKTALEHGLDTQCKSELRFFMYLPFEHSESIIEQEKSVLLQHCVFNSPEAMKAALEHRDIIQRFGRFPHRNSILGRHTTPAETAYLEGGGFKG